MSGKSETTPAALPGDCAALIVGPNRFQNALIAGYLESHGSWKSVVVDSFAAARLSLGRVPTGRAAILFDCFGQSSRDLEATLPADLEQLPPGWVLALFNLDRLTVFEKRALGYGVRGFFYQDDPVETLLKGLTAILGGEFWVSRQMMAEAILDSASELRRKKLSAHVSSHRLTRREVEILKLLTFGATNKIISARLFISPHTVRTHLSHIFKKIKASNRLHASIWATETLFNDGHG